MTFGKGLFLDADRLWIILLMKLPYWSLGNRSETQKGRGIERVNMNEGNKFNILKWYCRGRPVLAASQPVAAMNCA
jgi:hypothetical protein